MRALNHRSNENSPYQFMVAAASMSRANFIGGSKVV